MYLTHLSWSTFQSTLPTRGSDIVLAVESKVRHLFQSTLPTRGSDQLMAVYQYSQKDFNPRSPRGGATRIRFNVFASGVISIHAPHEGERLSSFCIICPFNGNFNPRSPRGGATPPAFLLDDSQTSISIHAPHEGERLVQTAWSFNAAIFQSTLPTRGSDLAVSDFLAKIVGISIHAPHEGERLDTTCLTLLGSVISIHAPHEGERRFVVSYQ